MSRQLRNIVISACVVVVLAAALLALNYLPALKSKTTASSSAASTSSSSTYKLLSVDVSKIKYVHIKNSGATFTVRTTGNKTYAIDELGSLPVSSSVSGLVSDAAAFTADRLITSDASSLKEYGLDNPQAEVEIGTTDGQTHTFYIGSKSPVSEAYYINPKGTGKVYLSTAELQNFYFDKPIQLVDTYLAEVDSNSLPKLTAMTFGGAGRTDPIVLAEEASSSSTATVSGSQPVYSITSPRQYETNAQQINTVISALESLTAESAVSLDVSDANLEKCGLKNPAYTFSFTYNKKTMTLLLGNTFSTSDGSNYVYTMVQGRNVIYRVYVSSLKFYNWNLADIANRLVFLPNIDDVGQITVSYGSSTQVFKLSGTGDNLKVTANGKSIKTDNFRNYYQTLIGVETEGTADKAYTGTATLTVRYQYRAANKAPVTMQFIPMNDRETYMTQNGKGDFYVLSTSVANVISKTEAVVSGKTVSAD